MHDSVVPNKEQLIAQVEAVQMWMLWYPWWMEL